MFHYPLSFLIYLSLIILPTSSTPSTLSFRTSTCRCTPTGGATHHFVYPLFFSFIDLEQISNVGWSLWPIFKLNGGGHTFCSLDEKDHLKDWLVEEMALKQGEKETREKSNTKHLDGHTAAAQSSTEASTLLQRALSFIANRTKGQKTLPPQGSVRLMTHLTYFGYCFNPISIFYCLRPEKHSSGNTAATSINVNSKKYDLSSADGQSTASHVSTALKASSSAPSAVPSSAVCADAPHVSAIDSIIVEVSNTPWIEQHSYMLDESVEHVRILLLLNFSRCNMLRRLADDATVTIFLRITTSSVYSTSVVLPRDLFVLLLQVSVTRDVELQGDKGAFRASWLKEFHVSPFMEMDYRYRRLCFIFTFSFFPP